MTISMGSRDEGVIGGVGTEEFRERRRLLRAQCTNGILLVSGSSEDEATAGTRYRQNSPFHYLTGVETPGATLVLLPHGVPAGVGVRGMDSSPRELLFLPPRDPGAETWTGPKLGPGEATERLTGFEKALSASLLANALTEWIRRSPSVGMLMPFGSQARLTREAALMKSIAERAPAVCFFDVSPDLARLRAVKSSAEIELIRGAVAITTAGHDAARAFIAHGSGHREYEVEAEIFRAFRSQGAVPGFPTIVGSGLNATVLHYEDNDRVMQAGELVVVDIGARLGHYSGDITRTYPVGGRFSPRQREIYTLVFAAMEDTIARYRPGIDTLQDLNHRCGEFLRGSPLRAKDRAGLEQSMDSFMPHRLGHHLGLDVHDLSALIGSNVLGVYGADGNESPLSPGAVITIEPGLYLPSESLGVRIEDDFLVTASGLERLGPPLASAPDEIEALMTP